MKLKRVEKWTRNKPEIQALLSVFWVIQAEVLYSLLKHLADHKKFANCFAVKDIIIWSELYKNMLSEFPKILDLLSEKSLPGTQHISDIQKLGKKLLQANTLSDQILSDLVFIIRKYLLEDFEISEDQSKSKKEQLKELEFIGDYPQIVFFSRVFIPCILLYRKTPQVLLKQAMEGDLYAFEDLLKVDKNITSIPELQAIWEKENRIPNSIRFRRLNNALRQSAYNKITIVRIKVMIATAIETLFKLTGGPISRTDIQELFDEYARDSKKTEADFDLQETPDGFSRAINRETKRWKKILENFQN